MSGRRRKAKSYHHGDLREALIAATDKILSTRGVEGFSLRDVARRAGVSPAAPAHHFGSAAGLLTEVATRAFKDFTQALRAGAERGGEDPGERLRGQGVAYVRFALSQPGRYSLMFRRDLLLPDDPHLRAASHEAYGELEAAIRRVLEMSREQSLNRAAQAAIIGAWAIVHGFASLALDGKLAPFVGAQALHGSLEDLLPDVLANYRPG
jgi:AcrR family transcriptional regulator